MAKSRSALVADSLERVQNAAGRHVVRSEQMSRTDRERLLANGYLQSVIKGWYLLVTPEVETGESTAWFASYWEFLTAYLAARFGPDYCLGAEASLGLHLGATVVPGQVSVITSRGGQSVVALPHGTTLVMYQDAKNLPEADDVVSMHDGLRMMSLPMSLTRLAPSFFERRPEDIDIALRMVPTASDLSRILVKGGYAAAAERLVGACRHLGLDEMAGTVHADVEAAGFKLKPADPFQPRYLSPLTERAIQSPYPARLRAMWETMRREVLAVFPSPPGTRPEAADYLHQLEEKYDSDAYNSLSIEGYRVTPELIARMRRGAWNPEADPGDRSHSAAMAAKSYRQAFKLVKQCIARIFEGEDAGLLLAEYLHNWYRALFSANVEAGLLREHDLIGYRRGAVYIKGSMHVPLPAEAVTPAMSALLSLLQKEREPGVRAVLGHFFFVFIHPYTDGNGRIARFLMNTMLASGGYPWTIVPLTERDAYMKALETASVEGNIQPFATFIAHQVGRT